MKYSERTVQIADLVIVDGRIVKNRNGGEGAPAPIPDGCYRLTKIEEGYKGRYELVEASSLGSDKLKFRGINEPVYLQADDEFPPVGFDYHIFALRDSGGDLVLRSISKVSD